jgi:hypothetical protein
MEYQITILNDQRLNQILNDQRMNRISNNNTQCPNVESNIQQKPLSDKRLNRVYLGFRNFF